MASGNTDAEGNDICININECVTTSVSQLRDECTCERCACQDTLGGYEYAPPAGGGSPISDWST